MSRKRHIHVDTFPFLAVLLCAMGSLILLLLVFDRRAKVVARAKAQEHAAEAAARKAKAVESDDENWKRKIRQLHELLVQQQLDLQNQLRAILGNKAATVQRLQAEDMEILSLHKAIGEQKADLDKKRTELAIRRGVLAKASDKEKTAQKDLERFARELDQLERTLHDLQALKRREKETYSLIPYHGKRGSNRKPIYVESTGYSLVFHPGGKSLSPLSMTPADFLAEVVRLGGKLPQKSADPDKDPDSAYVLFLVRPSGIETYYQAQAAMKELNLDFGYEFVEADWVFDFGGEGNVASQPWQRAGQGSSEPGKYGPPPYFALGSSQGNGSGSGTGPGAVLGGPIAWGQGAGPPGNGTGTGFPGGGQGNGSGIPGIGQGTGNGWPGGGGSGFPGTGPSNGSGNTGAAGQGTGNGWPGGGQGNGTGIPGTGKGNVWPGGGQGNGMIHGFGQGTGNGWPGVGQGTGQGTGNGWPGGGTGIPGMGGSGIPGTGKGGGIPGNGPGNGSGISGIGQQGNGFPGTGSGFPGTGSGIPGTGSGNGNGISGNGQGNGFPGSGSGIPGTGSGNGNGISGTGQGSGFPGSGSGIPGGGGSGLPGNGQGGGLPGNGSGIPGTGSGKGNGIPGTGQGNGFPGSGSAGPNGGNQGSNSGNGSAVPGTNTGPWQPSTGNSGNASASGNQNGPGGSGQVPGFQPPIPVASDNRGQNPAYQPDETDLERMRRLYQPGGGGNSGGGGMALPISQTSPLANFQKPEKSTRPSNIPLGRLIGNRDFILVVECTGDAVLIQPWGTRFPLASLPEEPEPGHPLVQTIQQLINRRQATVLQGETPYRPIIRFRIRPDGLRAYFRAYPLLEGLKLPMMRENVD